MERDPALDTLLDLDGQVLVIDPETKYWVRFAVRRVPASARLSRMASTTR